MARDMMFNRINWRRRAEAAETALSALNTGARLVDIMRNGRINRFVFIKGEDVITIETMGTWEDDVEMWRRDLLG